MLDFFSAFLCSVNLVHPQHVDKFLNVLGRELFILSSGVHSFFRPSGERMRYCLSVCLSEDFFMFP